AEDGIRDYKVTGVQTCALPILECHPEQVAVECEGEQLTYHQLNAHANRLAHALQRVGVGPNVLVGLYVERSVHMLLGMLAILKRSEERRVGKECRSGWGRYL